MSHHGRIDNAELITARALLGDLYRVYLASNLPANRKAMLFALLVPIALHDTAATQQFDIGDLMGDWIDVMRKAVWPTEITTIQKAMDAIGVAYALQERLEPKK